MVVSHSFANDSGQSLAFQSIFSPLTMGISTVADSSPLIYGLFRPECYTEFFHHHNFFDIPCLKLLLSKCLSYGILLGAVFVKVPQIVNIMKSKSTHGLSPWMYIMENLGYLFTVVYNTRHGYPFSTFGEVVFLLIQGFILIALFGLYNKRISLLAIVLPAYAAIGYYLYVMAPLSQLALFQTGNIALLAGSRLPQIWQNYRLKSTGVLSVVTVVMNVAGTTARIFTTMQEVEDSVVLVQAICSWALNLIIFLQVIWYWNSSAKQIQTGKGGQQKKETKKTK